MFPGPKLRLPEVLDVKDSFSFRERVVLIPYIASSRLCLERVPAWQKAAHRERCRRDKDVWRSPAAFRSTFPARREF